MKTKLITGIIAMVLILAFTSCSGGNGNVSENNSTNNPNSGQSNSTHSSGASNNTLSLDSLKNMPDSSADLFSYVENDEGISITRIDVIGDVAVIPSKIDGKNVTAINNSNNHDIKAVVIPQDVKNIGETAFKGAQNLEIVCFKGNNVTTIQREAFMNCTKLITANLPDSITEIKEMAFSGCTNLKQIDFPNNLRTIFNGAFFQTVLETVILPNGVETIDTGVFAFCVNLKNCTIPESVKSISDDAFDKSSSLTIITPAGSYAESYAKGKGINVTNS